MASTKRQIDRQRRQHDRQRRLHDRQSRQHKRYYNKCMAEAEKAAAEKAAAEKAAAEKAAAEKAEADKAEADTSSREDVYRNALHMLHVTLEGSPLAAPLCMRYMVEQWGWKVADNDPLYRLLNVLDGTWYWQYNWAPYMDDEERLYLFKNNDAEEIRPAVDAIHAYIKRFYRIQSRVANRYYGGRMG